MFFPIFVLFWSASPQQWPYTPHEVVDFISCFCQHSQSHLHAFLLRCSSVFSAGSIFQDSKASALALLHPSSLRCFTEFQRYQPQLCSMPFLEARAQLHGASPPKAWIPVAPTFAFCFPFPRLLPAVKVSVLSQCYLLLFELFDPWIELPNQMHLS